MLDCCGIKETNLKLAGVIVVLFDWFTEGLLLVSVKFKVCLAGLIIMFDYIIDQYCMYYIICTQQLLMIKGFSGYTAILYLGDL